MYLGQFGQTYPYGADFGYDVRGHENQEEDEGEEEEEDPVGGHGVQIHGSKCMDLGFGSILHWSELGSPVLWEVDWNLRKKDPSTDLFEDLSGGIAKS